MNGKFCIRIMSLVLYLHILCRQVRLHVIEKWVIFVLNKNCHRMHQMKFSRNMQMILQCYPDLHHKNPDVAKLMQRDNCNYMHQCASIKSEYFQR